MSYATLWITLDLMAVGMSHSEVIFNRLKNGLQFIVMFFVVCSFRIGLVCHCRCVL